MKKLGSQTWQLGGQVIFRQVIVAMLLATPAAAQSTKAQLNATIASNLADNTTGTITPAILRATLDDLVASFQQAAAVNVQTGTTYTFLIGDYGKLVTFNNAGAVAVTLPQATVLFSTFNVAVRNIGAGTVTITPTVSTINGAASLALMSGQSAWIVSNGTNYQLIADPNNIVTQTATIMPPAGFGNGLIISPQVLSGTAGAGNYYSNIVNITDSADFSGTSILGNYGLWLQYVKSGGKGGVTGLISNVSLTGTTSNVTNTNKVYLGGFFTSTAGVNDGGSDLGLNAKGEFFATNYAARALSGATFLVGLIGAEVDVAAETGSSAANVVGQRISHLNTHAVSGTVSDHALQITDQSGAVGWDYGITFFGNGGAPYQAPIKSTGTAIAALGAQTMGSFIDASAATITNNFLLGPTSSFKVTGLGATTVKSIALTTGANGSYGTFTCVSASNVTISNTSIAAGDVLVFSYESGTSASPGPYGNARTNGTSFQVACASGDTAVYNYALIKKGT